MNAYLFNPRFQKYVVLPPVLAMWYFSGKSDIHAIRLRTYLADKSLSKKMQIIPGWDTVVEPMIISQLARIFVGMYGFTQGLTSDNANMIQMDRMMLEMKQTVSTILEPDNDPPARIACKKKKTETCQDCRDR